MASTATQTESTSLAPRPPPSSASRPTTVARETELPCPSPSIENVSGFPRINTGYVAEPGEDDSEFNTAAYPYPNSKAKPESNSISSSGSSSSSGSDSRTRRTDSDPFAAQRAGSGTGSRLFTIEARDGTGNQGRSEDQDDVGDQGPRPERACGKTEERRSSEDPDAPISPTTSSRTQDPQESALTTPPSRDGHVGKGHERHGKHHATLVEKGWARMTGSRSSRSSRAEKD